jgi:murein DD-endopeptidase MepM/ murein hydrolase activator NlpD
MYHRLRQNWLASALVVFAIFLAALGSLRAASGASCLQSDGGKSCAPERQAPVANQAPDTRQTPFQGGIAVFALPPTSSALQDNLLPLQLAILTGGHPQTEEALTSRVALANPSSNLHWPASGMVTQLFGVPELGVGTLHTGPDIGVDSGSPVRAAQSGRVMYAGGDPCCGLGYWVEINHGDRYSTRYGHLMRPPIVLRGDFVTQGQILGFSGNTGFSTGPHVHFEVRYDGIPIDPLRVIPAG